jgi:hypothetical protein
MANNYGDIDKALNIESSIVEVERPIEKIDIAPSKPDDIRKDYEYTRANLYSLIEKGQEAINGIMELAGEGGSPRAYEVAGQLIIIDQPSVAMCTVGFRRFHSGILLVSTSTSVRTGQADPDS